MYFELVYWPWCDYPSGLIQQPIETGFDSCPTNSLHHRGLGLICCLSPGEGVGALLFSASWSIFSKEAHSSSPSSLNGWFHDPWLSCSVTGINHWWVEFLTWDRFWCTRHKRFVTVMQHCLCCLPHQNPFFDFLKLPISHHLGSSRVLSFSTISPTTS